MSLDLLRFATESLNAPLPTRSSPTSYVLEQEQGESIFIPGSGNVLKVLGKLQVWAGPESRILEAGDFASVPPRTTHSFQIASNHTEFIGLVVPGGWERFFNKIGEPYDGPLFPSSDDRPFNVGKFIAAVKEGADVHPDREYQLIEANGSLDKPDNSLPEGSTPYFLKREEGPKYFLGNASASPLITPAQSNVKFSIAYIEGSSAIAGELPWSTLTLKNTHTFFRILEGKVGLVLVGKENDAQTLTPGEGAFVLAGQPFKLEWKSTYGRILAFAAGGKGHGVEQLFIGAGERKDGHALEAFVEAKDELKAIAEAAEIEMQ
ncbi:RmlC-like cupin [Pseudohyphozyma bogoriensis]|nr:RmlC-like cupin [Pseudohyphozyma bogoriensis]